MKNKDKTGISQTIKKQGQNRYKSNNEKQGQNRYKSDNKIQG
jgi:hypothetical protein